MQGHVFISYVREDEAVVDRIQRTLEAAGVRVWRDTRDLWPGEDWRIKIRQAIERDSLVFIACFSDHSVGRKTYQNEELRLAVAQLRLRRPDQPWLIPIRLSDCSLPPFDLGDGKTLDSLQRVDLFGDRWDEGSSRLIAGVHRILSSLEQGRAVSAKASYKTTMSPPDGKAVSASTRATAQHRLVSRPTTLSSHREAIAAVDFSPDGNLLVAAGERILRMWNPETRESLATIAHGDIVWSVAVSPDASLVATAGRELVRQQAWPWQRNRGVVRLWDRHTCELLSTLSHGSNTWVWSVAFSPDGTLLASSGKSDRSNSPGRFVRLWNVAQRRRVNSWYSVSYPALAFSPDGNVLAISSYGGEVQLWDPVRRRQVGTLPQDQDSHMYSYQLAHSIAFSADGELLASAHDGEVRLWNPLTCREVTTLFEAVKHVAFSPYGNRLATASSSGNIKLWDLTTHTCIATYTAERRPGVKESVSPDVVNSLAFSTDGMMLACAGREGYVQLWDLGRN